MNKELKKMSRKELLEILLEQAKRIEELENKIEKLNEKLESKKVIFKNAGSLADASLQLSGIFNVAQEVKKYEKKISPVPKEIVDDHEEEKAYDINEVLMQARNNYKEDNLKRSLKQNPYEIREYIEKLNEEEEKPEVIDDMFGDLMATKTLKDGSIKEMIEKEKEDFEETTRATMNLGLVDKDFEELKDMHNSIKKNNIILKIFLGILILLALLVTAYAIYKII